MSLLEKIDRMLSAAKRKEVNAAIRHRREAVARWGGQIDALEAVRRLVAPDGVRT